MADDIKVADYIGATERLDAAARTAAQWWAGDYDLLLTPTLPITPPKLGSFDSPPDNPLHGILVAASLIAFVVPFNISGQPAISLPLFWNEAGLPIATVATGTLVETVPAQQVVGVFHPRPVVAHLGRQE